MKSILVLIFALGQGSEEGRVWIRGFLRKQAANLCTLRSRLTAHLHTRVYGLVPTTLTLRSIISSFSSSETLSNYVRSALCLGLIIQYAKLA